MPNDFEIDEKLTIAKNKPNEINITEGKIEGKGSLNIQTKNINIMDNNNEETSRIFFSDMNGNWFSSIGYAYAEGVRFLQLIGAAYGTQAEPKRRTRIMGDLFIRPSETSTGDIITSNGTIAGKEGRFQNLDVGGDLVIRDSTSDNQSRIFFSDMNGNWFSSIGYAYVGGKRYLQLIGAAYGTPQDTKRRTQIKGDLFITETENSKGDITIQNGILQTNDVLINSSQELKQDISNLTTEDAYSLIEGLEPVKFVFKDDPAKRENIGFIAEDVPDIVSDKDHKSVRYMEIISALTKVMKEQQKEINELKHEISKIKMAI